MYTTESIFNMLHSVCAYHTTGLFFVFFVFRFVRIIPKLQMQVIVQQQSLFASKLQTYVHTLT